MPRPLRCTIFILALVFALLQQGSAFAADATPAATPAATPTPPDDNSPALPMDPKVRVGRLDNGFTYYLRPNAETPERAELWLVVNAGSVLEEEDQRGIAHFLEHVQFHGTENFPGVEVLTFLQSIGMEFGPEINAYTSYDRTLYTLRVPTDDPKKVQRALDLLADWSGRATLDPAIVEEERGVIVEEWRTRDLSVDGRVRDAMFEVLLDGSPYVERLPIGDMDVVRGATADLLREFYTTWYRPDNMALVAVGDFADIDEMEGWIRARFEELPAAETSLELPAVAVPDYEDIRAQVITDQEFPGINLLIAWRRPQPPLLTQDDYRALLVEYLAIMILNERYTERVRAPDAAFLNANTDIGDLVRGVELVSVMVRAEDGGAMAALEAAAAEIERARQHGFTAAELTRAKTELLREYEARSAEQENLANEIYATGYVNHFLTGVVATGFGDDFVITQDLLPSITLAEVEAQIDALYPPNNRAVVVIAAEQEAPLLPDEAELIAAMEAAVGVAYDPFAATEVTGELLAELPPAATIRAEEEFAALGITRVVLDNGVELFLKPTDFKDDQVLLSAISVGGLSVVEEEDLALASIAAGLVSASGAGGYSMTELEQLLANKMVAIKPSINNLDEGFGGAASPQDLETIFQLLYLYASAPQIDPNIANLYEREIANYLKNRALEPTAALEDKYLEIFCGDSLHCNYLLLFQQLDEIDPKAALTIFRERFSDLDDLKLVLVGSFDVEEAKRYAQQYLGALPAARGGEAWRDVRPALPAGIVEETVYAGIEARSEVNIYFSGEYSSTLENELAVDMLVEILEGAITENLRGTRAGVYEVEVTSQTAASPSGRYELAIKFSAEPQRVEELKAAVFEEIALLHEYGPTASNYARVLRQFRRDHEENMLDNGTWMAWIIRFAVEQPGLLSEILRMDEVIEEVTPEDIQALARTLLPQDRHVTLILHPKDFADLDD